MKTESKKIAKVISLLENGPYTAVGDYKDYRNELHYNGYINLDNQYKIEMGEYCWLIWKHTDFAKDPQWKGEDLLKVVGADVFKGEKEIEQCLELQGWTYL